MSEADKGALMRAMEELQESDLQFLRGYMSGRLAVYADTTESSAENDTQAAGNAVNQ